MKRLFTILSCIVCSSIIAQDTTKHWTRGGQAAINFSQVSLTNWAAGGLSQMAGTGLFSAFSDYKKGNTTWENDLELAYGMIKPKRKSVIKSDDRIDLTSKYGRYAFGRVFYYTLLANFKTQFSPGYKYPNDSVIISNFLAPGYLTVAAGLDYKPNPHFSAFVSPLTAKITIVNDPVLSRAGAFGVDSGETVRYQFGGLVNIKFNKDIFKNVNLKTEVDVFSDYLNEPGNLDVEWETLLFMKVNKYLNASISTHLIYDDDIDIQVDNNDDGVTDEVGPRLQFKEVVNIGFAVKF